jgi:hypothetical protein
MRAILLIFVGVITLCICTGAQSEDCDASDSMLRDMRPPYETRIKELGIAEGNKLLGVWVGDGRVHPEVVLTRTVLRRPFLLSRLPGSPPVGL